jgi:hypothetical protein
VKKSTLFVAIALAFNSFQSFAQSVKGESITYSYVKLPSNPVKPKPASYQSFVTAAYEVENQKLLAQFEADKAQAEADYQREMAEYPNLLTTNTPKKWKLGTRSLLLLKSWKNKF